MKPQQGPPTETLRVNSEKLAVHCRKATVLPAFHSPMGLRQQHVNNLMAGYIITPCSLKLRLRISLLTKAFAKLSVLRRIQPSVRKVATSAAISFSLRSGPMAIQLEISQADLGSSPIEALLVRVQPFIQLS